MGGETAKAESSATEELADLVGKGKMYTGKRWHGEIEIEQGVLFSWVVDMVYCSVEVRELKDQEQFLCLDLAPAELTVGMALHMPVEAVGLVLELTSNLCVHAPSFHAGILFQHLWSFISSLEAYRKLIVGFWILHFSIKSVKSASDDLHLCLNSGSTPRQQTSY